jgi:hypothetical protein
MRFTVHSQAGDPARANEDWVSCSPTLVVVLDGVSARTDTGCSHGTTWFADHLGSATAKLAASTDLSLQDALAGAIEAVAGKHPTCDLSHPATPSAAVAILRMTDIVEYLVLADVTIALDLNGAVHTVVDDRVTATAKAERKAADRYPIGTAEKRRALLAMKQAELATRNQPGGYWVAAADPKAAHYALTGDVTLASTRRTAVLTDGAARIVNMYQSLNWLELLDQLECPGPAEVVRRIRAIEASDPDGMRWPRNKRSDDATIAFIQLH